MGATSGIEQAGREADNSALLDHAVQLGMVAYGVVHLLIGWLALQLAFGHSGGSASSTGAMHQLAKQPFGHVLVWLVAGGMLLLVVWRLIEAAFGFREEDGAARWRKRAAALGKAVVYGAVGTSAVKVALGSSSSSSGSTGLTAKLMDAPLGQVLVAVVGLAIIGYGVFKAWYGWADKFLDDLDAQGRSGETGTAYRWLGKVGHIAKGFAFCVVGALFIYAALTHEPQKSGGLDRALHEVLQQPFGPVLLAVTAVGIGCYGLFCFARAAHLSR